MEVQPPNYALTKSRDENVSGPDMGIPRAVTRPDQITLLDGE